MARTLLGSISENYAANISGTALYSRDMAWGDAEKTNQAPFVVADSKTLSGITASSANGFGQWTARTIINRNSLAVPIEGTTPASNTLTVTAHGYSVGDTLTFVGDGDFPEPLQFGVVYYVESVPSVDTFTLAYTDGGTVIDITAIGDGNINVEPVTVNDLDFGQPNGAVVSMTATNDRIVVIGHGLIVGDEVQFTGTGTIATPLELDRTYFVQSVVDTDTFTLSRTSGGTLLDLAADSTGSLELVYKNQGILTASPGIGITAGDSIRLRYRTQGSPTLSPQMEVTLT